MRADGGHGVDDAVLVAIGGHRFAADPNNGAPAGRQVVDRRTAQAGHAVTHEAPATSRFSFTKSRAEAATSRRLASNNDAQGLSRARMASEIIMAAAVPLVMPHFRNPVATHVRCRRPVSRPT